MRFDFHVHSVHSDGRLTVNELAALCVEENLDGFALTDHDTIAGWDDIFAAEAKYGVTIIPGIEISTEWENRDVHILGYGIAPNHRPFLNFIDNLRKARVVRVQKMVEKAQKLGMPLTYDDVASNHSGSVGRPHIAAAMVKRGYAKTIEEAFIKYLERGRSCYVPRSPVSPMRAVEEIGEAGGSAVLAHPGIDQAYQVLEKLVSCGLKGLEVYHSAHHPGMVKKFTRMAGEYGLFLSAGSDFHFIGSEGQRLLGSQYLEWDQMGDFYRQLILQRRKDHNV